MQSTFCATGRAICEVKHPAIKTIPSVDLYPITPDQRHRLRVISPKVLSVYVHESGTRPLPCFGDGLDLCEYHGLPRKRQHYLFVTEPGKSRLRLLRLTSGLVYEVLPVLIEEGRNLNGVMLELWRQHPGDGGSAMLGTIVEDECVDRVLLEAPDLKWAVERMLLAPPRLKGPWRKKEQRRASPAPSTPGNNDAVTRKELAGFIQALKLTSSGRQAEAMEVFGARGTKAAESEVGGGNP